MGQINITINGSFISHLGGVASEDREVTFTALDYGHANCVALAIEHLARNVLPDAIALDHALAEQGLKPGSGWRML